MRAAVHLFRPMRWYLQQLVWSPPGAGHRGTTNIELALDFEAATGSQPTPPGVTGKRTLRQKAMQFREAVRRAAELCGSRPTPGGPMKYCHAPAALKWPEATGWDCRAHVPRGDRVQGTVADARMPQLGPAQAGASRRGPTQAARAVIHAHAPTGPKALY